MRLIDADELKKMFPDKGEGAWTYNITAKAYIDAQPTVDQWHYPSKGEYPTEDGLYFVACRSSFEGGNNYTDFCHYKVAQERWINFFGHTNPDVYAWMPLPEPPKVEADVRN